MSTPYQAVIDYLVSKSVAHTTHPEMEEVTFHMNGKNVILLFRAKITHDGEFLQVTASLPFLVQEEKLRTSAAELITRINYCMPLGKFEMDLGDGEVRFHLTHIIGGLGLDSDIIEKNLKAAFYTSDRYFPSFMQHLHAGYTPEDAVFHAELDAHAEMIEETAKPKENPKSPESATRMIDAKPPRKPRRRKAGRKNTGQGELPI